jgi:molybdopterin-guanine dinucleotide biosynthesis protein MobB
MKLLHIIGRKNHGKTTLVVELTESLRRRGVRVGTIKHSTDALDLDTPGKDTHRHRAAGASPVALVSGGGVTVFLPRREDVYTQLDPVFAGCDVVLVEGDVTGPGPKVEVWRREAGGEPIAAGRQDIVGVVSDDTLDWPVTVWPRHDVELVAGQVLQWAAEV